MIVSAYASLPEKVEEGRKVFGKPLTINGENTDIPLV